MHSKVWGLLNCFKLIATWLYVCDVSLDKSVVLLWSCIVRLLLIRHTACSVSSSSQTYSLWHAGV